MSDTIEAAPPPRLDERIGRKSPLARLFARPEAGALAGAIIIYVFFFIVAPPFRNASSFSSVLYVSSTYGLMAAPVALLMIGGEFDLSAGVAVTSSALCASLFELRVHHERMGRRARRPGPVAARRVPERLDRGENRDTELPGHAGHVLHAARA